MDGQSNEKNCEVRGGGSLLTIVMSSSVEPQYALSV